MAKIQPFVGYENPNPKIPRPPVSPQPNIVTVQDGVPVVYPNCHGVGVRVVHPTNPKAPSVNFSVVMFYIPPHVTLLPPGGHEPEECYVILEGEGVMHLAGKLTPVKKGMFIHLPPWCEHGIENTGNEMMVVLICTSPPNP